MEVGPVYTVEDWGVKVETGEQVGGKGQAMGNREVKGRREWQDLKW